MNGTIKAAWAGGAVLVTALALGFACGGGGFRNWEPPAVEQTEAPDGDCDTGDLYESKPDPDCGGRWLGTPTPAARKTTAPAKGPTPRRTAR